MGSADSVAQSFPVYGVDMMTRRDFLKLFLFGGIFSLFSKKARAEKKTEKKTEKKLKEAMFWRKLGNE